MDYLNIIITVAFVLFMVYLVRGFVLQVQDRQRQREEKTKRDNKNNDVRDN